ncbi:MAG: hypothetical protein M3N46_13670 [Actinomycetota bacterium]|nr:hypothetical protein [Actinomycetota bacterium]
MRSRLVALGILAVLLGVGSVAMAYAAVQAQYAGQQIGLAGGLSQAAFRQQQFLFVFGFGLQSMVAPVAGAALFAVVAILAVLGRRSQLRREQLRRRGLAR